MNLPLDRRGLQRDASPTPPGAPLAMPVQDLRRAPSARFRHPGWRAALARVIAFGGAAALTMVAVGQMTLAFDPETVTALQLALRALFAATFAWIAFAATSALAGLLLVPRPPAIDRGRPLSARTAIVMPVYHEDPAAAFGALAALGRGLADRGAAEAFEIFVLSDTRDADAWVAETSAFAALRRELEGGPAAWYRRRRRNAGRKAGNVRDFVERWGGRYDFMVVLDADSVMDADAVIELVRRMEADAGLGLLQTAPQLIGGRTPFAMLQQFAGALYGRVVARGVAAWQGDDGNFWGHNAIIRVRAFAESAGLPELSGRKPFGGPILSHDFVEAALMRRAGWAVRMDPDIGGSWEGAPPSLLGAAARDRRWAQGNLQHLAVIGARGLRLASRAHMAIGIGSYLASPLWLAMLGVGLTLTAQATLYRPEYFPEAFQLFPTWPRFDAARMAWLFAGSMALLLAPKLLGLAETLLSPRGAGFGGAGRAVGNAALELVLSALVAPAMMVMQSRNVVSILAGRDGGWAPQERSGAALPWREAFAAHGGHVALGAAAGAAVLALQPAAAVWLAPVLAGLGLAPWLSRASGDPALGDAMARRGLLATPDERRPPEAALAATAAAARIAAATARGLADLARPDHAAAHLRIVRADADGAEEPAMLARVTAGAKIAAAASADQALGWLSAEERRAVAGDAALIAAWRRLDRRPAGPQRPTAGARRG